MSAGYIALLESALDSLPDEIVICTEDGESVTLNMPALERDARSLAHLITDRASWAGPCPRCDGSGRCVFCLDSGVAHAAFEEQ